MDRSGYVKLFRKSLDSDVFEDDVLWKVWTTCLMLATWEPDDAIFGNLSEAIHLEPGEFVTGQFSFHRACYPTLKTPPVSSRTIWRKLFLLQSCKMLSIKVSKRYSIVSITKWEAYQGKLDEDVKENGKNLSRTCQEDVKNLSTLKKIEDIKEKTLAENPAPAAKDDKPKAKPKRKTTFPQGFTLTDQIREYAKAQGYHNDLDRLFEDFRIHHCSKGTVHLDWSLALMKWIRNEVSWGKGGAQPVKETQKPEPDGIKAVTFDDPAFQRWEKIQKERENAAAAVG